MAILFIISIICIFASAFFGAYYGAYFKTTQTKSPFDKIFPRRAKIIEMNPELDLGDDIL